MTITKNAVDTTLTLALEGRLDTSNSSELEKAVNETLETTDDIELDLSKLEYTSSSGLRVFLLTQKKVSEKGGNLVVSNVNEYIMEIFDITGFSSILNIK